MKDEIKEILDILTFNKEDILNKICSVEDFVSREQIIKLLDYITNLQEEKDKLKAELELYKDNHNYLNDKIDKAIEYIKENEKEYGSLEDNEKIILNILKGE